MLKRLYGWAIAIYLILACFPAGGQSVSDEGFESPTVGSVGGYFSFAYRPSSESWIFNGNAGIAANGSGFGFFHSPTPSGNQFCFLQGMGSGGGSVEQRISGFERDGICIVSFLASQRDIVGRDNTQNQVLHLKVDGIIKQVIEPADTSWSAFQSVRFAVEAGAHSIEFAVPTTEGDATILLDAVSITFIPFETGVLGFRGMGVPPGGVSSSASGISADGRFIVGTVAMPSGDLAVRYSVGSNFLELLDSTSAFQTTRATAVSDDGRVVVGNIGNTGAFVWDPGAGMRRLVESQNAYSGQAFGIAGDAKTIVGSAFDPVSENNHPYVWVRFGTGTYSPDYLPSIWFDAQQSDGQMGLPVGAAYAVSRFGQVIAGQHLTFTGPDAIHFGQSSSFRIATGGAAFGVAADGETLVGKRAGAFAEAFLWTSQRGVVGLGDLDGGISESVAKDASHDGTLIVGYGSGPNGREAVMWTSSGRVRTVRQVLSDSGIDPGAWVLQEAVAISDDGLTITGNGINPAGKVEGWVAVLPPAPVILSGGTVGHTAGSTLFTFKIEALRDPSTFGAGPLPAGLQLNPTTGVISGLLQTPGVYSIPLSATNAAGTGSGLLTVIVGGPVITSALTAEGFVEKPFNYQVLADRFPRAGSYTASGLPDGLRINAAGQITGTPREEGEFSVILGANNIAGSGSAVLKIVIGSPIVGFENASPVVGKVGQSLTYQVNTSRSASGFSAQGLPPGLSISPNGLITGTPTSQGVFPVTIFATNVAGTGNVILTFAISPVAIPSEPEYHVGHGLRISKVEAEGEWDFSGGGSWSARVTISNPTGVPSFPVRLETSSGGATLLNEIPAWGEIVVELRGFQSGAPIYAKLYERPVVQGLELKIPQDGAHLISFLDYPTAPPSGGTTQTSTNTNVPGFTPVRLKSVLVSGPSKVFENSSTQFNATAVMSDGSIRSGQSFQWSASPLTISEAGLLAAGEVSGDQRVNVIAGLSLAGVAVSDVKRILIIDTAPPEFSALNVLNGIAGRSYDFQIAASGRPTSYSASGLTPLGLSMSAEGRITGELPVDSAGVYSVSITATNAFGSTTKEFALTIRDPGVLLLDYDPTRGSVIAQPRALEKGENVVGVGEQLTLKAKAKTPQWVFAGWSIEGATPSMSAEPTLTLVVGDFVSVKAEFIPNPFIALADRYNGRVHGLTPTLASTGTMTLKLTSAGAVTGKLYLGTKAYTIKGVFRGDGTAVLVLKCPKSSDVVVNLTIDLTVNGTERVTGSVAIDGETLSLDLERAVFVARKRPAPQKGRYTVVFKRPVSSRNEPLPQGHGFAAVKVNANGNLRLVGMLGDGTPFAHASTVSQTGRWPFHSVLYKKRGVLSGDLSFREIVGSSDVDGALAWIKPPLLGRKVSYSSGFTTQCDLVGSRYNRAMPLPFTEVSINFDGGGLPVSPSLTMSVSKAKRFTSADSLPLKLKLSIRTGLFAGSLLEPGVAPRRFKGALLEKSRSGSGWFFGENSEQNGLQTGFVELHED